MIKLCVEELGVKESCVTKLCVKEPCVWQSCVWKGCVWQTCVWKGCATKLCLKESVTKCVEEFCDKVVCDKNACERNVRQSCVRVLCDKVVRLTKATRAQTSAISATPATQSEGRCHQVPRLPRRVKVDVSKCHTDASRCGVSSYSAAIFVQVPTWVMHHLHIPHIRSCPGLLRFLALDGNELKIPAALSAISSCPRLDETEVNCFAFLLCLAIFFIKKRLHGLSRWTYSDFAGSPWWLVLWGASLWQLWNNHPCCAVISRFGLRAPHLSVQHDVCRFQVTINDVQPQFSCARLELSKVKGIMSLDWLP